MKSRLPPPNDKDTLAAAFEEVVALLKEAGQAKRELAERERRRMVRELGERLFGVLREEGA